MDPPWRYQAPRHRGYTAASRRRACAANPAIRFEATPHGGHCAFINSRRAGAGIYWGEGRVVEFSRACLAAVGAADPAGVIAPE